MDLLTGLGADVVAKVAPKKQAVEQPQQDPESVTKAPSGVPPLDDAIKKAWAKRDATK
jgi:hypothetical protein